MKRICYLNNLLSWRLSLFVATLFMALGLSAQQSCYEQYLRAHNMSLPTDSMVIDDSYDELKKEVIARQLMRNERTSVSQPIRHPIFLAIDTLAGTCHLLAQDGTILADVHLAMVDSTWYMWLSVDPLADKNIANTPYMYCNGNPIMFIDPDGRDIYNFDENGIYMGDDKIVRQSGEDIIRWNISDSEYQDFRFNDSGDAKRICELFSDEYFSFQGGMDNNAITKIIVVGNDQIDNILNRANLPQKNIFSSMLYALFNSRGTTKAMDFVNDPYLIQNEQCKNALFVRGNSAYNHFDFGNYIWGCAMRIMNIPEGFVRFGSNFDNGLFHLGTRDTSSDQRAIFNGFYRR